MSTLSREPSGRAAALGLGTLTAIVVIAVLLVDRLSKDKIEAAQETVRAERLAEVLPNLEFDSSQPDDTIEPGNAAFTSNAPLPLHRFWQAGKLTAVVMQVVAPDGYNGDIVLLVGIKTNGVITGVRVVSHRETPGLGDDIERRRSEWITHFTDLALGTTRDADWTVEQHGGRFDAFTGATITPQAVIHAVHSALRWYDTHSATLISLPRNLP